MQIRYSLNAGLEIQVRQQELEEIRQTLLAFLASSQTHLSFTGANDFNPAPYDEVLEIWKIEKAVGPAKFVIADNKVLCLSGSAKNLENFMSFLRFGFDDSKGAHNHYEYHEGNKWIASDSEPVIIALQT